MLKTPFSMVNHLIFDASLDHGTFLAFVPPAPLAFFSASSGDHHAPATSSVTHGAKKRDEVLRVDFA